MKSIRLFTPSEERSMICIDKMVFDTTSLNLHFVIFFFLIYIFFKLTDSNQTRQRKRRRLGELRKTLGEKIVLYNTIPGCEEKTDTEAACSLSDDFILPWEAQGDAN